MEATLLILRIDDRELRFVFQLSEIHQPTVMEASTVLHLDKRQNIIHAFEKFATCVRGLSEDEPEFRQLGQVLFRVLLPRPIQVQLQALDAPLTILTNDPTLPWEILHDGEEYIALKLPVARQLIIPEQIGPVLRHPGAPAGGVSALVIADPTGDLPGAAEEGNALRDFFATRGVCHLLLGTDATWENIHTRLLSTPYSIVHYCGHIDYDPVERLSSIRLRGEARLSSDEAPRTLTGSPIVFLNACYSDLPLGAQAACSRTESFAQAFMLGNDHGVATAVVGTMWRVPDEPQEAGREFSLTFYRYLFEGHSIADAMKASRLAARTSGRGPMVWGPYVLYGSPSLKPFAARPDEPAKKRRPLEGTKAADETTSGANSDAAASEISGSPPGASSLFHKSLEKAVPLDTEGRQVVHLSLREMQQFHQGALSSVHLLIGLCAVGVEPLARALSEKGVDATLLSEKARARARRLLPREERGFGVSESVVRTLAYAAGRAKALRKKTIGAEDLLAGLAKCENSEAMRLLASFGVSARDLLEPLGQACAILNCVLESGALDALKHAVRCAEQANLSFFGTPHLLIGLIRTGSIRTVALLRGRGVSIERLCQLLQDATAFGAAKNEDAGEVGLPSPTKRCSRVLRRARDLAQKACSDELGEVHILRAILEEDAGLTANVLRGLNANPKDLLSEIADVDLLARRLAQALRLNPEELASAFSRISGKGGPRLG